MAYGIRLRVSGRFALFVRPELKVERVSYDVMTPSAARGILEAIHWKPAIRWSIDAIHVLKPIRFQSIRRNEVGAKAPVGKIRSAMKSGEIGDLTLVVEHDRQQRASTVLVDVDYVIAAHFDMTAKAGPDDNPAKHAESFSRRARKGQCFHQPCLGTREFPADFSLIEPDEPMPVVAQQDRSAALGFGAPRDLGLMLYDIDHERDRSSMFFRARLVDGVLQVPASRSLEVLR
ncbi:type I-C CRISPR-associated protein Cas5c [Phreatobacter sp. AB_2022a]|uniref:type I-C CRISPR-associated protein Cas5c n=1 Tax=Phreatobacter sp. AB_2022a TaxID=3003134 RepID=UPI0022873816|nr:type I-C CRISPR-associated protein Cas5c [Phreatobacter sp. AB_2022a]MCZ0735972.1 type I-C CRISPR-associated protein Cas5c [Phreatobacter sp. AB_2022a]